MKIGVSVLQDFSYQRATSNTQEFYRQGSIFYVDMEDPEQKAELLFLLSNNFPHRNKISIEYSASLLQVLSISEIQELDEFPENAAGRKIIFWHTGLKRLYMYSGNTWIDLSSNKLGNDEEIQIIPPLFGEIVSNGLSNETEIAPAVITNGHISPDALIELAKLEVDPRQRSTHTGTQLWNTVSNFKDGVKQVRLDEMAAPATSVSLANQKISDLDKGLNLKDAVNVEQLEEVIDDLSISDLNVPEANVSWANYGLKYLADPSEPQDAVNMRTLDMKISEGPVKLPVRVVDTSTLPYPRAGSATIDGVAVVPGQRVLRASTTSKTKNVIWEVQSGTWTIAADSALPGQLKSGVSVNVQEGQTNANSTWLLTSPDGPIVPGTSQITFERTDGTFGVNYDETLDASNGSFGVNYNADHLTVGANGLEIADDYPGNTNINTVGTITTGIWNGSVNDIQYGGTGGSTPEEARNNLQAADLVAGTSLGIQSLPNFVGPLTLEQGGTGFNADSPKEVLDFLGGVGNYSNASGTGISVVNGITNATLSNPKQISFKTLVAGSGVSLQDNGTNIVVSSFINALNINSALSGYPLSVLNGGTGVSATTPVAALNALTGLNSVVGTAGGDASLVLAPTGGTGSVAKQVRIKDLSEGFAIALTQTATAVTVGVDKDALAIDINDDLVGYPLTLANGGTGVVAATPTQALNALGGLYSVSASSTGTSLISAATGGTGSTPKDISIKGIAAGLGIVLTDAGTSLELAVDKAALNIDINTDLVGYPLDLVNGGTGGTYASLGALLSAQGGVFELEPTAVVGAGEFGLVGAVTNDTTQGKTYGIKKVANGDGIDIVDDGDTLTISNTVAESPVKMYSSAVLSTTDVSAPYGLVINHNLFTNAGAEFDAQLVQVTDSSGVQLLVDAGTDYTQTTTTLYFTYPVNNVKVNIVAFDA